MIERAINLIIRYRLKEVCPDIYYDLNKEADDIINEWKKKEVNKNGLQDHKEAWENGEKSS